MAKEMDDRSQEVSKAIREIVETEREILGARLPLKLSERVPGWKPGDAGARKLSEFISSHVKDVVVARRSGMDVVYTLGTPVTTSPSEKLQTDETPDLWRIWVSPNSAWMLVVPHTGLEVAAALRGSDIQSDCLRLEPPDASTHRRIVTQFLERLSSPLKDRLEQLIEAESSNWWQQWVQELRKAGQLPSWNGFRRQAFESELVEQLRIAGLEPARVDNVLRRVHETHLPQSRPKLPVREAPVEGASDAGLRRIVGAAIMRMSVAELRELRLPVGIVLDVLAASKS